MKKNILSLLALAPLAVTADVSLSHIFTSNMVIQRDQPITIWGTAEAGEKVAVTLTGETEPDTASATADDVGAWAVTLPKRGPGKPLQLVVQGNNKIELKNILMGDVWLCSGQSNMVWGMRVSENAKQAIKEGVHPDLRLFAVNRRLAKEPEDDIRGSKWWPCVPRTLEKTSGKLGYSAVAYYFGRRLKQELGDVPVGLIVSAYGGSRIETWTTEDSWKSVPELAEEYEKLRSANKVEPAAHLKNNPQTRSRYPICYNSMIHGLSRLKIKGTIWYQGEANMSEGALYFHRQRALVNGWREIWGKDMPFYFVQLAPYRYPKDKNTALPHMWLAQQKAADEIPNSEMAVTIDVGNAKNVHPGQKRQVGERLAGLALKHTYGKDVEADGPVYKDHKIADGKITISFDHAGKGLATRDGQAPREFEVAGEDGVFHPATAVIASPNKLILSSPQVAAPVKARHAWKNTPDANLMAGSGLPVPCFETQ
ncbi:sialate O-acetylesterase [Oceaniferula spumae]